VPTPRFKHNNNQAQLKSSFFNKEKDKMVLGLLLSIHYQRQPLEIHRSLGNLRLFFNFQQGSRETKKI